MEDSPGTGPSTRVNVRRVGVEHGGEDHTDFVAVEEPLEIRLVVQDSGVTESQSISITMRTPGDDTNLAAGFLFTEGVIPDSTAIAGCAHERNTDTGTPAAGVVNVELSPGITIDHDRLQRHFYTTSSCGVCGKSSLEALSAQAVFDVDGSQMCIEPGVLSSLPDALMRRQSIFSDTGGLHAAGLFQPDGTLLDVREDVGRHNAVDKLIGHALMNGELPWSNLGVLVSGRASFEIMQKLRMAGCPLVAAVGAPSSLAVELAWEFDITLVGFLRDGRFNVYSCPGRIG